MDIFDAILKWFAAHGCDASVCGNDEANEIVVFGDRPEYIAVHDNQRQFNALLDYYGYYAVVHIPSEDQWFELNLYPTSRECDEARYSK